jgi:hypothetical protein
MKVVSGERFWSSVTARFMAGCYIYMQKYKMILSGVSVP